MPEEILYKRTVTARRTGLTYLFSFKSIKHPDLYGNSIKKDFWNDIYDYFSWDRRMTLERVDRKEFTLSEVKKLHEELIDNMHDDSSVVVARFVSLKKIEFIDYGEVFNFVTNEDGTEGYRCPEGLSEKEMEKEWKDLEGFRRDLSHDMSWLDEEFEALILKKMLKNFGVSDIRVFRKKESHDLRYCLERFERFRNDKKGNFSILYNVIEKIQNNSIYKKILLQADLTEKDVKKATGIMNNNSIRGSRHEGKSKKVRGIKRDELQTCEEIVKKLIASWLRIEDMS